MWKARARRGLIAVAILLVAIQAVPYGRRHTNLPVRMEPRWDSPQTRALVVRACYDCHSNQTIWPWYSHVAPVSWFIQGDVDQGRAAMNLSEWDRPQREAHESAKKVQEGEMPPWAYPLVHPEARFSPAERQALIRGLTATLGQEKEREGEPEED
ncbi:MAG: heme-binding domain-containing protein [Armatimonadetes bacterium]|nr:heme-binding domain-containing protein [Armatimonadota bacterium]